MELNFTQIFIDLIKKSILAFYHLKSLMLILNYYARLIWNIFSQAMFLFYGIFILISNVNYFLLFEYIHQHFTYQQLMLIFSMNLLFETNYFLLKINVSNSPELINNIITTSAFRFVSFILGYRFYIDNDLFENFSATD